MLPDSSHIPTLVARYATGRAVACPGCRRPLTETREDRCTNCDERLILRVDLAAHPRTAPLIAGILGLAFGIGFAAVVLFTVLVDLTSHGVRRADLADFLATVLPPLLMLAIHTPALVLWIRRRNRLRCRRRAVQALLATGCWALTAAGAAAFFAILFTFS